MNKFTYDGDKQFHVFVDSIFRLIQSMLVVVQYELECLAYYVDVPIILGVMFLKYFHWGLYALIIDMFVYRLLT